MVDDFQESNLSEEQLDALLGSVDLDNTETKSPESSEIDHLSSLLSNIPQQSDITISDDELKKVAFEELGLTPAIQTEGETSKVQKAGVDLKALYDINVRFSVELGRTFMYIKDIIHLAEGSIIELDKNVGDEVEIYINDRLFARGKLIIIDEFYGVQITQILHPAYFKNL